VKINVKLWAFNLITMAILVVTYLFLFQYIARTLKFWASMPSILGIILVTNHLIIPKVLRWGWDRWDPVCIEMARIRRELEVMKAESDQRLKELMERLDPKSLAILKAELGRTDAECD